MISKELLNSESTLDEAFDDLQADMTQAFEESLRLDELKPSADDAPAEATLPALVSNLELVEGSVGDRPNESSERLTVHTLRRLATLSAFDKLYREAQEQLQDIDAKLAQVRSSHHLTGEFSNTLQADIHRASDLETANASLIAELARLTDQFREAEKKQQEHESVIEALQRREANLTNDRDAVRVALAAAKLELVEAAKTIARNEAELGDLIKVLSDKTIDGERRAHENEALRKKNVNLAIDFDKALNREAEARRELDKVSTIQAKEAARNTELIGALGQSEKEVMRLRILLEGAQAKQSEMSEEARIAELDREAQAVRDLAEMRGLSSEIQSLQTRLNEASDERNEASSEVARLVAQLRDAAAEKQIADEKFSAHEKENELDKLKLAAANEGFAKQSLDKASVEMQLDVQRQECEDLRGEIEALNARIVELLPYERLHRVAKARQQNGDNPADVLNPPDGGDTVRPPKQTHSGTRRAAS
jgi:chromosome segregation ATPase